MLCPVRLRLLRVLTLLELCRRLPASDQIAVADKQVVVHFPGGRRLYCAQWREWLNCM